MIKEHNTLYVIRNKTTGNLVLSYNPSSQIRKALFASERTANNALQFIKKWTNNEEYIIEAIS